MNVKILNIIVLVTPISQTALKYLVTTVCFNICYLKLKANTSIDRLPVVTTVYFSTGTHVTLMHNRKKGT